MIKNYQLIPNPGRVMSIIKLLFLEIHIDSGAISPGLRTKQEFN